MERKKSPFTITIITMLTLIMVSCSKSDYKVKVKYINMTGEEIKGLKIGKKRIGKLNIDEETEYFPFKEYHFDSGLPDEPIEGKIDNDKIADYSIFYDCGTQKYIVNEGTFEIEIHKWDHDDKIYLVLDLK
jgi:hypothetical protein